MKKATRKKWQGHYEQWQASGKTQRAYCDEAGIKYSTFKNIPARFKVRKDIGKFQPVKVIEAIGSGVNVTPMPYCKIAFSNGDEIMISSATAMGRLKGLMECLI